VALFSVSIPDCAGRWYDFCAISVLPKEQGKSIGSEPMNAALRELKGLKANGCVLLGDTNYCHRLVLNL